MPKPKLKRTSGLPRVGKRLLKRRGFGPASLFEPCLTSVVQIALKPASKGLGLRGVFIRGKGLKYAIAHSNVCKSTPRAPAGSMLTSIIGALHFGQAGRPIAANGMTDGRR